jgi:hypothetical protein
MQNRFDEFLMQNRAAFDNDEPPMDMWERIADKAQIDSKAGHKPTWMRAIRYAAAVAVVVLGTTLTLNYLKARNAKAVEPIVALDCEVNEAAAYYEQQILAKQQVVFNLTANQPAVKEGIEHDLAGLDSALVQLKRDLKENISNAEVIEAMIQNYRLKLAILEEVLGYMEPANNTQKSETHDL